MTAARWQEVAVHRAVQQHEAFLMIEPDARALHVAQRKVSRH